MGSFERQGAINIGSLYRALPQPGMRIACLTELTGTDVFGNEEIEHLLQYMRAVCPMSLTRYVNAMHDNAGFGAGAIAERVFKRRFTRKRSGNPITWTQESTELNRVRASL